MSVKGMLALYTGVQMRMADKRLVRVGAVLCAVVLVATSCGSDKKSTPTSAATATTVGAATTAAGTTAATTGGSTGATSAGSAATTAGGATSTAAGGGASDLVKLGLWDDGPCDDSKPKLTVGLVTVFASAVLTLGDQADALTAAAKAFNARGGANGHCIVVHNCDDGADPNKALNCVRDLDQAGVAATVNDTTSFGAADVAAGFKSAGIPRFAISPGPDDFGDTNAYPFDAGGTGTSIMMPQGLLNEGKKKISVVRVDAPAAAPLAGFFKTIFGDNGLEVVADSAVAAGTTDYSQFILTAQDAGAEGVAMPIGGQEGIQVLQAGKQLSADLTYSASLGTFPYSDIAALGDYGGRVILNAAIPPATADVPVLDVLRKDLAASGEQILQPENMKASPMRSWVGLYALLYILRQAKAEDFSRANLTKLIEASGPIPMLGLTRDPWTPKTDHQGTFLRTGNNDYSFWKFDPNATWNGKKGNFVKVSDANWDQTICGTQFGGPCS